MYITNTFEDIEATFVVTDVFCLFVSLSNGPYQILSVKSPSEFPLNEQPCKTNFLRLFKQFFCHGSNLSPTHTRSLIGRFRAASF